MSVMLAWLKHLLLLVPAVGSLLTGEVESRGWFMFNLLAGLLLLRLGETSRAYGKWLLPVELLWLGFLAYEGGGLMFMVLYSTLVTIFTRLRTGAQTAASLLLGTLTLNLVTAGRSEEIIWMSNIVWFAMAALLHAVSRISGKRHYLESLYDELTRSHEELRQARARLQEMAAQIEHAAQAEERSRIAKDIHDDLGHRLIRQKMMMEAALGLFERQPERAQALLRQIRDQMEEGMERMRSTVRRLSPPDGKDGARRYALDRLIADAGEELGLTVTFHVEGRPRPLYPSTEYVLYCNAREAITNAVRHGGAKRVDIILDYRPSELSLTIANDGTVPDQPIGQGLGVRGMKERIALLGGRLEFRTEPAFAVTTVLPMIGEEKTLVR